MVKSVVFFKPKQGMSAMRHSATTPEYARTRADEPNFIAPGEIPFILTTEHVIVA